VEVKRRLAYVPDQVQVTGGMAGDDLLMAGPSVMPEAWARWFRCRPTGLVLNLMRKELRLLRPLWLIRRRVWRAGCTCPCSGTNPNAAARQSLW